MASIKFKIRLDEKKRVKLLINYIKKLQSDRFFAEVRRKFEAQDEQRTLERQSRLIIQELIYNVYQPKKYRRTYSAIRSIKVATARQGQSSELIIYSDVLVAEAKLNPGLSYITFFQKPIQFNSFIKPRNQRSVVNYRPFAGRLEALMRRLSRQSANSAYFNTIKEFMPPQLEAGI